MDEGTPAGSAAALKSKGMLRRLSRAFGYSINGLRAALRHEAAFRTEALLFAVLTPVALWLPLSGQERAVLIGSILLVLIVELLNSALEALTDRVSTELHPLSGRAKDLGSAAVFLTLVLVAITWGTIALPVLLAMLGR